MSLLAKLADAIGSARALRRVPLGVIYAVAAALGAFAVRGLGDAPIDTRAWAAVFAAFAALCCAHARRWPWVLVAGAAAVATSGGLQIAAIALLAWALLAARARRRSRHVGAVIGACAAALLLAGEAISPNQCAALGALTVGAAAWSAYFTAHKADRVVPRRVALVAIAGALACIGGYAFAALDARADAVDGVDHLRAGLDAAKATDADTATAELKVAARKLQAANDALDKPWAKPVRYVPFIGANARAVDRMASSGATLAQVASDASSTVDLDRVTFTGGRIDLAVARQVGDASGAVSTAVDRALRDLDDVRSPWLIGLVREQIDEATDTLREAQPALANVRDAATIAPIVLAEGTTKHYLVLFTTPVEARGMIGFPGNFAELEVTNGRIRMTRFGRVGDELYAQGVARRDRTITGPAEYLARYERYAPEQTWHNVTMSPDFPTVAQVVGELYPQSGGRGIDGVLSVDPTALAAFLELTGPVTVPGLATPITSTNAVEFLQLRQYVDLPLGKRIDVLEAVALAAFERMTSGNLPAVQRIADVLAPTVREHHLRFAAFDDAVAPVLQRAGIDGAFPEVAGDSLAVLTHNAGGNKIDAFLERTTSYDVVWDAETGELDGTLRVVFTNTAPASGLPDYVIGNSLTPTPGTLAIPPIGTNRMIVSVYTPWRPETATLDGAPANLQIERELGRFVASTLIDVPPGGSVTLTANWHGTLTPAGVYLLDVIHQPQASAEQVTVQVRNTTGDAVAVSGGTADGATARIAEPATRDLRIVVTAPR